MEVIKKQLYEDGYVETLFGRRVHINNSISNNQNLKLFAERQAINAPIQGTAADIIKLAMIKLKNKLKLDSSKILLQVHDELVFEVLKENISNSANFIKQIMETANLPMKPLKVKLKVDYGYAKNWAEAH